MKVLLLIGIGVKHNQFWQQTSACTVNEDRKLRNGSNIRLPVLKIVSKTTVDTKIANTRYATLEKKILHFIALHHQPKIYNLKSLRSSQLSLKYLSTLFFLFTPPSSSKCFLNWEVSYLTYHQPPLNQC